MRQKIFKFTLDKPKNLNRSPEAYCNIIQCGRDKFTLKNFKLIEGHDDSLPYSADLFCNNIKICHCYNDGYGGPTEIKPTSHAESIRLSGVIDRVSKYKWSYGKIEFNLEIEFIADTLAIGMSYDR